MSNDSLYKKSYSVRLSELGKLAPATFRAFGAFNQQALSAGALSAKLKELIAVAVAHVTGCPYCIEAHVKKIKELEASKEEMTEAIMVATALKAGSAMAHGANALQAYDETGEDDLYTLSSMKRLKEFREENAELFRSYLAFSHQAMKPGLLSQKEKECIAVAIAHVTGCAYCIDGHTKMAKKLGVTMEELTEAIFVATALKAGSALAHSINALNAYDE
ncbi:alkylhydroperoxidase [Brevibacillus choshinensis]|uniref:Alkylhydroperoxidase n=1 Tax=Brevibacillus choshinensis TaxID=54911 RepID=A0ABR5N5Z6_BRECH|nr:carboxymuconolactone decarboxylase family protein [Brevibacillus choshinensis]KQL46040.1 alkylhydroperoxidase [Brevibacillus choshinensis]